MRATLGIGVDSLKRASSGINFYRSDDSAGYFRNDHSRTIAAGKSIRYLIPDAALDYIAANHLYSGKRMTPAKLVKTIVAALGRNKGARH